MSREIAVRKYKIMFWQKSGLPYNDLSDLNDLKKNVNELKDD